MEFKTIAVGNQVSIIDNSLVVSDGLPLGTYYLRFNKMKGFFLTKTENIKIKEKIYGNQENRVKKVLSTFESFERNLGVLMSGEKGIGKSLFTKLLMEKAINKFPIIIIDEEIPGIPSFLDSIKQEVIVIFDEFDKIFTGSSDCDDEKRGSQDELLSLFDGMSQQKKMFVITCNQINKISSFFINRPGRFHYHFRFGYPTIEEMVVYLRDNLNEEYHGEIDNVTEFGAKVYLNYDCLRAIVFELNLGRSFAESIVDLNIINTESKYYDFVLTLKDGRKFERTENMDIFNKKYSRTMILRNNNTNVKIKFDLEHSFVDENFKLIVDGKYIHCVDMSDEAGRKSQRTSPFDNNNDKEQYEADDILEVADLKIFKNKKDDYNYNI